MAWPPFLRTALATSSMEFTGWFSISVMMSPSCRPHCLAGHTRPSVVWISDSATTMTPLEKSLMPTVRPTGMRVFSAPASPAQDTAGGAKTLLAQAAWVTSPTVSTAAQTKNNSQFHTRFPSFISNSPASLLLRVARKVNMTDGDKKKRPPRCQCSAALAVQSCPVLWGSRLDFMSEK